MSQLKKHNFYSLTLFRIATFNKKIKLTGEMRDEREEKKRRRRHIKIPITTRLVQSKGDKSNNIKKCHKH